MLISHSLKQCKYDIFCMYMYSLIAHMHRMLIKAIGCVTGVIEFLCWKTSAAVNDVKA